MTDIEVDLSALSTTQMRMVAKAKDGAPPGPEAAMLKIRGTEIRQSINDLTRRALGPYAMPFVSRRWKRATTRTPSAQSSPTRSQSNISTTARPAFMPDRTRCNATSSPR